MLNVSAVTALLLGSRRMSITLLDVAAQTTPAQVLSTLLAWLSTAGLPRPPGKKTASRVASSRPSRLPTQMRSTSLLPSQTERSSSCPRASGSLQLATNRYDLTRKFALPARGPVLVTNNSGSPLSIVAGQLLVRSTQTLAVFRNLDAATIADGATAEVTFQADEAGLSGNCAVNTATDAVTPYPGVTFNNPGDGVRWLAQIGTREESDRSLRTRCRARWPQRAGPVCFGLRRLGAVDRPSHASPCLSEQPRRRKARIIVAGDSNPLDASVVIATDAFIQPIAGLCVRVETTAASAYDIPINATVCVTSAYLATAAVTADAAVRELIASKKIGEPLYVAEIIEAIMASPGVGNTVVTTPATDVTVLQRRRSCRCLPLRSSRSHRYRPDALHRLSAKRGACLATALERSRLERVAPGSSRTSSSTRPGIATKASWPLAVPPDGLRFIGNERSFPRVPSDTDDSYRDAGRGLGCVAARRHRARNPRGGDPSIPNKLAVDCYLLGQPVLFGGVDDTRWARWALFLTLLTWGEAPLWGSGVVWGQNDLNWGISAPVGGSRAERHHPRLGRRLRGLHQVIVTTPSGDIEIAPLCRLQSRVTQQRSISSISSMPTLSSGQR